jgi:hypothetical protein
MTILYTNNADDCTLLLYLSPFAGVIKLVMFLNPDSRRHLQLHKVLGQLAHPLFQLVSKF